MTHLTKGSSVSPAGFKLHFTDLQSGQRSMKISLTQPNFSTFQVDFQIQPTLRYSEFDSDTDADRNPRSARL